MGIRVGSPSAARAARRSGFTIIELIVALTLGAIVVGAALSYFIKEVRVLSANEIREDVLRNGRYVGVALRHDLQRTGIGIEATTKYATVNAWPGEFGDTLVMLYVPYGPTAPAHAVQPPADTFPVLAGSYGDPQAVEVVKDAVEPLDLAVGDLVRVQLGPTTRRLAMIKPDGISVKSDTSVLLTFTDATLHLNQPAGIDGLDLPSGTYVQKLTPIMYYLADGGRLMRAVRLKEDGTPDGHELAYQVERFDVKFVFEDGDELEFPNPFDSDETNDMDDIASVKVLVTVRADRTDPRVNHGELLRRTFQWIVAPRNLRYQDSR